MGVDMLEGVIDLQFAPLVSGLTVTSPATGGIHLQGVDTSSTVIFNTLTYSIENVQLTLPQHTSWLIGDSRNNTHDIVILLTATQRGEPIYMIITIPVLEVSGGSAASDPGYLSNIGNGVQQGAGIQSCFPKKVAGSPAPLFAYYVTCYDGYTTHAHTQNVQVFVSTVGLPVSSGLLTRIKGTYMPQNIKLPSSLRPVSASGITEIRVTDFHQYISVTSFSMELSNAGYVATIRNDPTSAYKCVELDPDTLDESGNIKIDLPTGDIASSTLNDILAERAILKEIGAPKAALESKSEGATFMLAILIVAVTIVGLYYSIFSKDTDPNDTIKNRGIYETGITVIIGVLFLAGAGVGLFSKDTTVRQNGGIVVAVAAGLGVLFYLFFFLVYPPPLTTECQKTAAALAQGKNIGTAANRPSIGSSIAAATTVEWTSTKVAALSAVLVVCSFLVGMTI